MPITHKFYDKQWEGGFQTQNGILISEHYKPEVLFLGTFNPDTHGNHNLATFFYGRSKYFWPVLHSIFNLQAPYNQVPPYDNLIWPLCINLKLSFADLIANVIPNVPNQHIQQNENNIIFNNQDYNLLGDADLIALDAIGQVSWNTDSIIEFINNTPTLKYIYLTQKSDNLFSNKFNFIKQQCHRNDIVFRKIHTPTGRSLPGTPGHTFLAMQWLITQAIQQPQNGFSIAWLHGYNIHSFNFPPYSLHF